MRFALTAAALAALTIASAPAAAQGNPAAIQKLCPDLSYTQVVQGLTEMAEGGYTFSTDPDENKKAEQTAYDLCGAGYNADTAEADDQPETIPAAVGPPQRGPQFSGRDYERNMPVFRHNGPPPRRYGQGRMPPPWYLNKRPPMPPHARRAYPGYGHAVRRPVAPPPYGYGPRRAAPPAMAMVGAGRRGGGYGMEQSAGPLPFVTSERGEPYCPSSEVLMSRLPPGYPPGACYVSPVPGKPCPGIKCDRR